MTLETYTYPDRAHETVESLHRRCQALKRAARSPTLETSQDQKCPKCDVFVKIGRDGTGEAILVCPGCRELIKPEFQF